MTMKKTLALCARLALAPALLFGCDAAPLPQEPATETAAQALSALEVPITRAADDDDDLPAGFDGKAGLGTATARDGTQALHITAGDPAPDETPAEDDGDDEGVEDEGLLISRPLPAVPLVTSLRATRDTWARRYPVGVSRDHGRSCELRVNRLNPAAQSNLTLVRFALPSALACANIKTARLVMTAAQLPVAPLFVRANQALAPWMPGPTGYRGCATCNVGTGYSAPFALPPFAAGPVTLVNQRCHRYTWDVTAMVKQWCANPARNHGIVLTGHGPDNVANFHSMESPLAAVRPRLVVTY